MTVIKCAICAEYCPNYTAYVMHKELMHNPNTIKTHKGKFLTNQEKSVIIERVEKRLGKEHFIG